MKYLLVPIVFPIGFVISVVAILALGALFAVQAVFGYDEPVIDD